MEDTRLILPLIWYYNVKHVKHVVSFLSSNTGIKEQAEKYGSVVELRSAGIQGEKWMENSKHVSSLRRC